MFCEIMLSMSQFWPIIFFPNSCSWKKKNPYLGKKKSHISCKDVFNFSMPWAFFLISPLNHFVIWKAQERKKQNGTNQGIAEITVSCALFCLEEDAKN